MSLAIGRHLRRRKFIILPIPSEDIDLVHALAHAVQFGLAFYNMKRKPLNDNNSEQDDQSYNPESDSNENDDNYDDDFDADYSRSEDDDDDCGANDNVSGDDNDDDISRDDDCNDNGYNTPAVVGADENDAALGPYENAGVNQPPPAHVEYSVSPETPGVPH